MGLAKITLTGWNDATPPDFVVDACKGAGQKVSLTQDPLAALASKSGAHVVLFFHSPSEIVRDQILAGHSPSKAVALWSTSTKALLGQCRRHRSNVTLASLRAAAFAPVAFLTVLSGRLGSELAPPPEEPAPPDRVSSGRMAMAEVLARGALSVSPLAQNLLDELDATAIFVGDMDVAGQELFDAAAQFLMEQGQALAKLKADCEGLQQDLAIAQAEGTVRLEQIATIEAELTSTRQELDAHVTAAKIGDEEMEAERADSAMLLQGIAVLEAHLDLVQRELEENIVAALTRRAADTDALVKLAAADQIRHQQIEHLQNELGRHQQKAAEMDKASTTLQSHFDALLARKKSQEIKLLFASVRLAASSFDAARGRKVGDKPHEDQQAADVEPL